MNLAERMINRIKRADRAACAEDAPPEAEGLVARSADHMNKSMMLAESAPAVAQWQLNRAKRLIGDAEKLLEIHEVKRRRSRGASHGSDTPKRKTRRTGKTERKRESEGWKPSSQRKAEKAQRDREIRQRMQGRKGAK